MPARPKKKQTRREIALALLVATLVATGKVVLVAGKLAIMVTIALFLIVFTLVAEMARATN